MFPKCFQMFPKCSQMFPKCSQNFPKCSQTCPKSVPNISQKYPKIQMITRFSTLGACKTICAQSCKNVQTVGTSRCYFFWPVLIFGKSTRKTGENTRKQAKIRENRQKTGAFLVLIFLGGKLVGANFYTFCNYGK